MTHKNEQAQSASENGPDMAGHVKATSGKNFNNDQKSSIAQTEEKILKFWQDNQIFEKTLEKESPKGEYVFYDGPPFATGMPHYGHILAGIIKDIIPRYKTMQGYHVDRKWGWDCHGLPIENLIQKENNLKTKIDIEKFGIKKFNKAAKESVFTYKKEWEEIIPRTGRFVDMKNCYTTMDSKFTESVMWAFKTLYDKGMVYEGFKSMHISPALETPLSNFEVNQNYQDITDISVYVKFKILNHQKTGSGISENESKQNTYLIAWTTTPWTLPGNVALAVGEEIDYVKVRIEQDSGINSPEEKSNYNLGDFILAKSRLKYVFKDKKYKIIEEFKGSDLVGLEYEPVFSYYKSENYENIWKVYGANFVTTEDGTGIVHIAPAFGEDDLILSQKHNLPFIQHVNMDGTIKSEVTDFAGLQAKPKSTKEEPNKHQSTDIEIIKYLAQQGSLFSKEKITHSYPHCWRSDAPLLNYAMSSWFIKTQEQSEKMVKLNKKINWIPKNVGEKRFGNWLENVKDWGISRSRFWGSPIPIWKNEDGDVCVLGSLAEIKDKTRSTNRYFLMRHGEADHNVNKFLSSDNSELGISHLTEKGKRDVADSAEKLALKLENKKIDLIFTSPLKRTLETTEILSQKLNISEDQIITDDRLKEIHVGVLNGKPEKEFHDLFKNRQDKFTIKPEGGENLEDIRKRVGDFIYEINQKYENKNILIITHDYPILLLRALNEGYENTEILSKEELLKVQPAQLIDFDFAPIPHDEDYILDYHRPYIDEIKFEIDGKTYTRIEDVFDTWFDSGSMPFTSKHYPFNQENFNPGNKVFQKEKGFPADFIAEGLDQTRGWFYTLLALNTALFGKSPYKNVIVNGLALAEDGKKMSKRLKNYPDPTLIFDKYGADAMRYYMIASPIVRGEPLSFSEKGVDEVMKKINNRLLNTVSFYEMYASADFTESEVRPISNNPLDNWILNRLSETCEKITLNIENYELDRASRPIADLIEDLSTWYLRRSRDRFKLGQDADKNVATKTFAYVLLNTSKILAPFMPFLAEEVYQRITQNNYEKPNKSVHLTSWPKLDKTNPKILNEMTQVRELVTYSLEARDKANVKVRQPLKTLFVSEKVSNLDPNLLEIIKEEVNVKEIKARIDLKNNNVDLDIKITKELKEEGEMRELIRFIQSLRKTNNLKTSDKINLKVNTDLSGKNLFEKFESEIKKITNIEKFDFVEIDTPNVLKIENRQYLIDLEKINLS